MSAELGTIFLDAGILYRTLAHYALQEQINLNDETALIRLAANLRVTVTPQYLRINNKRVLKNLDSDDIDAATPFIAAYPTVRTHIRRIQQAIAATRSVVYVGRDIGTVILPEADVKIWLNVSLNERVERRYKQFKWMLSRDYIRSAIEWRDTMDSTRPYSPMKPAADAITLTTDGLSKEESTATLMTHIAAVKTSLA